MRIPFLKTKNILSKFRPRDLFVLLPSLVIYLSLTLRNITTSSIWFDEGFTINLIKFNFFDIAKYTAYDVHPPLYYWTLKIWTFIFGTTELAVRSMSTFFGALALVLIYLMVKDLFNKKAATLALLFSSVSPMLIRYGVEARMYTMVLCVVILATWIFSYAMRTNSKKYWTAYGVLIALGMWIHYFTAIIWIAHWIYRAYEIYVKEYSLKGFRKKFFSREWVRSHLIALGIYLPWLPVMAVQATIVQVGGFWIGPVGMDSLTNYVSNTFYYAEHGTVAPYLAFILLSFITLLFYEYVKTYKKLNHAQRVELKIISFVALIAPVVLFILSLPPLKSIFVERYLLSASVFFAVLAGIVLANAKFGRLKLGFVVCLVVFISFVGINNVYYYGNYNKNSNTQIETRKLIEGAVERSGDSEPIIAADPWIYYEAAIYSTAKHPIYFAQEYTDYKYGYIEMLKQSDDGKIKDIQSFIKDNYTFWYIAYSDNELSAPYKNVCKIDGFDIKSNINNATKYKAVQYRYCIQ
jgi:uncharacterized membrane protein